MAATSENIAAPLVFQCNQCHAIVGDSFSWVCSMQELHTITLSGTIAHTHSSTPPFFLFPSTHIHHMSYLMHRSPFYDAAASPNLDLNPRLETSQDELDLGRLSFFLLSSLHTYIYIYIYCRL